MNRCYENAIRYEFDIDGHTHTRCGVKDRFWKDEIIHKEGRKLCPHYGGKCPALMEVHRGTRT